MCYAWMSFPILVTPSSPKQSLHLCLFTHSPLFEEKNAPLKLSPPPRPSVERDGAEKVVCPNALTRQSSPAFSAAPFSVAHLLLLLCSCCMPSWACRALLPTRLCDWTLGLQMVDYSWDGFSGVETCGVPFLCVLLWPCCSDGDAARCLFFFLPVLKTNFFSFFHFFLFFAPPHLYLRSCSSISPCSMHLLYYSPYRLFFPLQICLLVCHELLPERKTQGNVYWQRQALVFLPLVEA